MLYCYSSASNVDTAEFNIMHGLQNLCEVLHYIIPPYFKQASITPRIKKSNMYINVLSKYRLISQLPTLAKIFERIISKQLINHRSTLRFLQPPT